MDELDRIRTEYARRARDPRLRGLYSLFRRDALHATQTRERAALDLLRSAGFAALNQFDVLEVGCGEGGVLLDVLRWGGDPARLHGCDLLPAHAAQARRKLPNATAIAVADGGDLPYPSDAFDLVLQFTVLTSVLDQNLRRRMAAEMWRILRAGGAVLWYDFRYPSPNPAVRAIHPREARSLFPKGTLSARRVTLAPPLARRIADRSWFLCELLAALPWLRTHDLILIRKEGT